MIRRDAHPTSPFEADLQRRRPSILRDWAIAAYKRPLFGVALLIILVLGFAAVFGASIAPYDYNQSIGGSFDGPSTEHWFGTDRLGRDQFSRVLVGARISVVIGLGAIVLGTVIALLIGVASGTFGGVVDLVLQRIVDAWMAFPALVLLLTIVSVFGTSERNIVISLGLLLGVVSSRVVRSAVLTVAATDYVFAAESIGAHNLRIMLRHVVPNVMPTVIIMMSVNVGFAILAEASLSFLGFGVQPPAPSWGSLLSTDTQYMIINPWLAIFPGLAITLTVFAFNVLGDGLRDLLDPRLRGSS